MIFKKAINPNAAASKKRRITKLTNYILSPQNRNENEKCIYSNSRGFIISDTPKSEQLEMIALANENVKSKDPIEHYIISWQLGEQPTTDQIEQSIDILIEEMGIKNHQIIYGVHDDTKNIHLHLAINRINPSTLKATRINGGFDIEAGHKAIARITAEQGWNQEQNDLYEVLEDKIVYRKTVKKENVSQKSKRIEIKTGEPSAERIGKKIAAPLIKSAASWQELHESLAKENIIFERKGSGAIVWIDNIALKASSIDRKASLGKLEKRLGPYEERKEGVTYYEHRADELHPGQLRALSENDLCKLSQRSLAYNRKGQTQGVLSLDARAYRRGSEGVRRSNNRRSERDSTGNGRNRNKRIRDRGLGNVAFNEYVKLRKEYNDDKKYATQSLKEKHTKERELLFLLQKENRIKATTGDWKGRGKQLNAIRSMIAAEHTKQRLELKERHNIERLELIKKYPPYPDFDIWESKTKINTDNIQDTVIGDEYVEPKLIDIRSFNYEVFNGNVFYSNDKSDTAFIDRGRKIDVFDIQKNNHVLAALQLAATKWGSLHIDGSQEYKNLCLQLAAEHGFKILNPELKEALEKKKEAVKAARMEAMKTRQQKLFEIYHQAVNADRYRVTAIRMFKNGGKKAFILDKKDGVTNGFYPNEITNRMREMIRMQKKGENVYYTPLSKDKHHILIDDMSKEKVRQLIKDGYKPAILLESSPENYQCIITIPKLGSKFDKDIGNRLTERLNKEYGDQNLSGCIHPHRAPGFDNRKPKHQRKDGTFPEVKILKAEQRVCEKSINRAKEIEKEYQELAKQRVERRHYQQKMAIANGSPGSPVAAFEAHLKNIQQHLKITDKSRVDAMIAVRMRATGHNPNEIQQAIMMCGPSFRENEQRNWERYAERTVEYAFSLRADKELQRNEKYIEFWKKIEQQENPENKKTHRSKASNMRMR